MSTAGKRWGVRTFADLKDRSRVDDETGCWMWAGATDGEAGNARVWLSELQRVVRMSTAIFWLQFGELPTGGVRMVPRCGRANCGNPAHRVGGDASAMFRAVLPVSRPIARGGRARAPQYSPELAAQIRTSEKPAADWARELGLGKTLVAKVKRGEAWLDSARNSSAFTWRP
jgi:hypothetical protein